MPSWDLPVTGVASLPSTAAVGLKVATVWQTRSVRRCAKRFACVVLCDYYNHPMGVLSFSPCLDEAYGVCNHLPKVTQK